MGFLNSKGLKRYDAALKQWLSSKGNAKTANGIMPDWTGQLTDVEWMAAWQADGKKIKAMSWENAAKKLSKFISSGSSGQLVEVWKNASPKSPYAAQNLVIPGAAGAQAVLIVYKAETASDWQFDSSVVPAGSPRIWCPHKSEGDRMSYRAARFTDPSSGKIEFSDGYRATGTTEAKRNDDMIPNMIYAWK